MCDHLRSPTTSLPPPIVLAPSARVLSSLTDLSTSLHRHSIWDLALLLRDAISNSCFTFCARYPSTPPSKHILNAQVSIRAPCCKKFFDCPQCHAETQDHNLRKTLEMVFMCKKCKKAFRKDMSEYEEADEYCPHCDNQYVIEAKEPKAMVGVEGEDARVDNRMLKDDRMKDDPARSLFATKDVSDKVDQSLYELLKGRQAAAQ
ncbi:hypothetical protein IAR55_001369 [Kwoniella newhampshirensis]|uniref:CHY-type domain-containing protein n=1 Tax=Kwoniella newhampshirensis TaxID=1651941 RepID=A0AAW0Z1Z3_9TREE